MNRRPTRSGAPLAVATLALVLAACARSEPARAPQTTRPAAKQTCAEAVLESDFVALDRILVPFGPELLGIETTWGDEVGRVELISGGYFDDIFEAYDDMEPTGEAEIRGHAATVLASTFLDQPIWAATWRENEEPPCDAHAIIAIGLDEPEFRRQLRAIR